MMNTYPLYEEGALAIDEKLAAWIIRHDLLENGVPYEDLKAVVVDTARFKAALAGENDKDARVLDRYDMLSIAEAYEVLEAMDIEAVSCCSEFTGDISAIDDSAPERHLDEKFICWIPANRAPDLFRAAYESLDELESELRSKLNGCIPEDIPIRQCIAVINGVYWC